MKILIFFMLTSLAFAEIVKDQKDCDPVKAVEVLDSFTLNNIKKIKSHSEVIDRSYNSDDFTEHLGSLCFGLRFNNNKEEFDTIINIFLENTSLSREKFFSKEMFNLKCPNNEHFLHHVMKRNPVDFERLISQEDIQYPKDIPREYKVNIKITLFDLLKEFKSIYLSKGWGNKFGLFLKKLRKLGNES